MTPAGRQRGSVLVLVPATVLVLLVLAVIAVDAAVEYLGHRELADFAASAADDVAAKAVDRGAFYQGVLRLDPDVARATVTDLEATATSAEMRITDVAATVSPDGRSVTVTATAVVTDLFAPAVSSHRSVTVHARATATVQEVRVS